MQPLVPELHGEAEALLDAPANSRTQPDWRPSVPAHVDRIAHQDQADLAFADQLAERLQVGALVRADQVGQALGGDAQRVADGQSDAFFAEIEGQNAGDGGRQVNFIIDAAHDTVETRVVSGPWRSSPNRSTQHSTGTVQRGAASALPVIAMGVVIAILYFGRVFFITSLVGGDHRVHPGAVRGAADAASASRAAWRASWCAPSRCCSCT